MATERQMKILQYLSRHSDVEVTELSDLLQISASTVRRELAVMEQTGLLERQYGRVQLPVPIRYELPFENRAAAQVEAKRKIAALATTLIRPGQVIGLSGGTTPTELARHLRTAEDVTVVTNAVNVAIELKSWFAKRVMVTGGILDQSSYELVGDTAVQNLGNVHLDIAFQGVSGIDLKFGFSVADEPAAVIARTYRRVAEKVVVLADHSKIGQSSFVRAYPLNAADILITDDGVSPEQRAALEAAGLTVLVGE